jgi:hypothetical protein
MKLIRRKILSQKGESAFQVFDVLVGEDHNVR